MSKTIRFLVLSSVLVLSALFITGANAQSNLCIAFNLDSESCELITQANENTKSAGAVAFTYEAEEVMVTGFFDSEDKIEGATGVLVYDETGLITSAKINIESISSVTSFSDGTNALSFILVDGIIYFGVGETLDSLVWEHFPAEFTENLSFNIDNLITVGGNEATGNFSAVDTNWTKSESGNETVFSASIADVDPFAMADEEALSILGDTSMSGNMNASLVIAVNNTTTTISTLASTTDMTYSINSIDTGGIIGEEETGLTDEENAVMNDLLGGLLGDSEQQIASSSVLTLSVEDVDTAISAPEGATSISDELVDTLSYTYATDPFGFIKEYYTEYTFLYSFSFGGDFSFGDETFDWGAFDSIYYYSGMCGDSVRNHVEQGSIEFGGEVAYTLESGNADIWTFDANEGDVVTITMTSPILDSYLELIAPDGTGLASDDDGAGYPDASIKAFTLEQSGTFQVVACSYNDYATGDYTVSLGN